MPPGYFVACEDMGTQHDKVNKRRVKAQIEEKNCSSTFLLALATMGKYKVRGKNRLV
jgi:hypothetical protein